MMRRVYALRAPKPPDEREDPLMSIFLVRRYLHKRNVVEAVLHYNGLSLQHVSDELKDDIDVVDLAIDNNPIALQYASARLRDDDILVHKAINKNHVCFQWASTRLRRHINTYKYLSKHNLNDVKQVLPINLTNGLHMELLLQIYDMNPEFCLAISSNMVWKDYHFVYHVLSHNPSLWKKHRIEKIFAGEDEDGPYYADHCIENFLRITGKCI